MILCIYDGEGPGQVIIQNRNKRTIRRHGYWNSIKEGIVIQYNVECVRVDYNGGLSYLMSDSQSLSRTPDL